MELLNDVVMLLPPFDASAASRALSRLKYRDLFRHGFDMGSFCNAGQFFSVVAMEFLDVISELDINPIKVLEKGCIGLDALLVTKS